ncbi:hypothetical protein AB0C22_26470 [Micromonospora sp. NPDC048894]|uniref:hypothetical protein n=1 Tax=Micromonospora sp. NPDC048894 TaxID=3155493 RepID=UPI0033F18AEB
MTTPTRIAADPATSRGRRLSPVTGSPTFEWPEPLSPVVESVTLPGPVDDGLGDGVGRWDGGLVDGVPGAGGGGAVVGSGSGGAVVGSGSGFGVVGSGSADVVGSGSGGSVSAVGRCGTAVKVRPGSATGVGSAPAGGTPTTTAAVALDADSARNRRTVVG